MPVLQVHPEILDRLVLQLGHDGGPDAAYGVDRQPGRVSQVGGPGRVLGQRGGRGCTPLCGQLSVEPVGRHIDRVHRPTVNPVAGIGGHPGGVGVGQPGVDIGQVSVSERGTKRHGQTGSESGIGGTGGPLAHTLAISRS